MTNKEEIVRYLETLTEDEKNIYRTGKIHGLIGTLNMMKKIESDFASPLEWWNKIKIEIQGEIDYLIKLSSNWKVRAQKKEEIRKNGE